MPRKSMDFVEEKEIYDPKEIGMSEGKELGFDEPMEYEVDYEADETPLKESLEIEDIEIEDAGAEDAIMYEIDIQNEEISTEE
jgi:hypothetical protein